MKTSKKSCSIQLLDCTLGSGGALISYRFGEYQIRDMQKILRKSRMDVVEYGILCSYSAGLDSSVYATTELPVGFVRMTQQMYALLLDKDSRPLLSALPKHSDKTADIIRMCFSSEREQEDIDYCVALQKKGYRIAIMVEETAQYSDIELTRILQKINALKPWACYIYDQSGIFTEKRFQETLAVYARELSKDICIGFQGRDNLQILSALAEIFLAFETEHARYLDVSMNGLAQGALQLASSKTALWLNEEYGKDYNILELEYQESFLENYVNPKNAIGAKLLYSLTARETCSYKYAEYYSNMDMDVHAQMDVFPEIQPGAAFKFSKRDANAAIVAAQKKALRLGMFVFTQDHPERMLQWLEDTAPSLLRHGVDVVICDSSEDERTKSVVFNYTIDGYCNIFYLPVPRSKRAHSMENIEIVAEYLSDYDYIWPLCDDITPMIENFYLNLTDWAEKEVGWIVIDAAYRNNYHNVNKLYKNCLEFFYENSARIAIQSASIFKAEFLASVIERRKCTDLTNNFSLIVAALQELAANWTKAALFVGDTYFSRDDNMPKNMVGLDVFEIWGQHWYDAVYDLPTVYDPAKPTAVRFQANDMYPFRLESLLHLRSHGSFGLGLYRQNRGRLAQTGDTSAWKYYMVALLPKCIAKQLWVSIKTIRTGQGQKTSAAVKLIYKVYQKLGRK